MPPATLAWLVACQVGLCLRLEENVLENKPDALDLFCPQNHLLRDSFKPTPQLPGAVNGISTVQTSGPVCSLAVQGWYPVFCLVASSKGPEDLHLMVIQGLHITILYIPFVSTSCSRAAWAPWLLHHLSQEVVIPGFFQLFFWGGLILCLRVRCEVTLTTGKWQSCQMDLAFYVPGVTWSLAHYWTLVLMY